MGKKLYQLKQGETLKSVATELLGDESRWQELAYINSLTPPYFVAPGTILLVPTDDSPLELIVTKGITAPPEPAPDAIGSYAGAWALAGGFIAAWLLWGRQ